MRISTQWMHQLGVNSMLEQQARLAKTQAQVATGQRYLAPADNPDVAARTLGLDEARESTRRYQASADTARARLAVEENALVGVGHVVQRVRELALAANNDTQSAENRRDIAREVRELLDELLALANTRDANGEFLFAGNQSLAQPFVRTAGGVSYAGDDGQRFLAIGPSTQVATGDSGTQVFRAIRNGNGTFTVADAGTNTGTGVVESTAVTDAALYAGHAYTLDFTTNTAGEFVYRVHDDTSGAWVEPASGTPDDATVYARGAAVEFDGLRLTIAGQPADGDRFTVLPSAHQDLFVTVENLARALEAPSASAADRARLHNAVNRFLADVDQAEMHLLSVRGRVGARLQVIEQQKEANEGYLLQLEEMRSLLNDLDYAEATTRLNLHLTALQAAQQVFLRVQNLSLFNLLR